MIRTLKTFAVALLVCVGAQAATINTTLTVTNATGTLGATITATGQVTLTNIGNGTFTATISSLVPDSSGNFNGTFKIALSGGSDTITGTLKISASLLAGGGTGTGSAAVTGGTGTYNGATGSFPSLAGTGQLTGGVNFTLSFSGPGTITTGGAPPPPSNAPTITAVLDGASYSKNVAQGSLFIVKGSLLSTATGLNQFSFPLPTAPGGVKITFTPVAGGAGTDAFMVYTYNQSGVNQLAAILPSTVPVGNYNVTVTNNNGVVGAGFPVQVVARKPTLITRDSSGTGLAVIQIFTSATSYYIDALTSVSSGTGPAAPGSVLVAWATGFGPVSGGDNTASPGFNFATGSNVQVILGGINITPDYAGRAPGLAGADQINFTLPANVPTGCAVPFQVSVQGVVSNTTYIAIAPDASSGACVMPGFTTSQLQKFDQGGSYTFGSFSISQISQTVPQFGTVKIDSAGGAFTQINAFHLASPPPTSTGNPQSGVCQVIHIVGSQSQVAAGLPPNGLDAGTITLNGPGGSNISNMALTEDPVTHGYSLSIGTEGISIPGAPAGGTIVAGTYSLAGAGGTDVGKFNASVALGSPLTITGGLPSVVTRSAGLPLSWTGGNASDLVEIIGFSGTTTGTGANATIDATEFVCTTTAGAGSFTVPSSILQQLPAVSTAAISGGTGIGFLEVGSSVNPATFTAPLTAGGSIDTGVFIGFLGIGSLSAYQ